MLPTDKPFVISLANEKIKRLEVLSHKENKSIEKIIEEIIDKSLTS